MSTASKERLRKERLPAMYCVKQGCLWHTNATYCPRHTPRREAPYKSQARRIAQMYNALAQTEARPDLEELNG
jgi:hypothetical protein